MKPMLKMHLCTVDQRSERHFFLLNNANMKACVLSQIKILALLDFGTLRLKKWQILYRESLIKNGFFSSCDFIS